MEPGLNPMRENVLPTEPEVVVKVSEAVATALDLKPTAITPEASLEREYHAESLDLLEIVFLLEKTYRVRMPRTGILQHAEEHFGEGTLVAGGELTELGLRILRRMRPDIDPDLLRPGLRLNDVNRFMTTQTFVRLVLRLLEAKEEARRKLQEAGCEKCGGHRIQDSQVAPEFVCADCGADFPVPNGDDVLVQDLVELDRDHGI